MEEAIGIIQNDDVDKPLCSSSTTKIISRYYRETCVGFCPRVDDAGLSIIDSESCSEESACCILIEEWCIDDDGVIIKQFVSQEKLGEECDVTTKSGCNDPNYETLNFCYARGCKSPE